MTRNTQVIFVVITLLLGITAVSLAFSATAIGGIFFQANGSSISQSQLMDISSADDTITITGADDPANDRSLYNVDLPTSFRLPQACDNGQVTTSATASASWSCANLPSGGSAHVIEDEGSVLTQRNTLNFTGAGVTCTDDAGNSETDCDIPSSSGTSVILDLADDDVNESIAITEIAVTGDTNSIFTEPTDDKLLILVGNDWPNADTADALAANPSDCAANQFADAIDAEADLTCNSIVDADVPDTITIDLATTATALAANPTDCAAGTKAYSIDAEGDLTCTPVDTGDIANDTILEVDLDLVDSPVDEQCLTYESGAGGDFEWQDCAAGSTAVDVQSEDSSVVATADTIDFSAGFLVTESPTNEANITLQVTGATVTDDFVWVGNSSNIATETVIGDCDDSSGNHLNYDTGTNAFSCGNTSSAASQNLFETITDGATSIVADSTTDTFTITTSGAAVSTIFNAGSDTITIVVDATLTFSEHPAVFIQADDVSTTMAIEDIRLYNFSGFPATIIDASCAVNTTPTTDAVIIDINLDGTTIFTTQANRPQIEAGDNVGTSGTPDITEMSNGSSIQIEIDQTDSGDTAADLTCQIRISFRNKETA